MIENINTKQILSYQSKNFILLGIVCSKITHKKQYYIYCHTRKNTSTSYILYDITYATHPVLEAKSLQSVFKHINKYN